MSKLSISLIFALVFVVMACQPNIKESKKAKIINQKIDGLYTYERLPFGAIEPEGWIKEQLVNDLKHGYYAHYPSITTTLSYDLFINQNRKSQHQYDDMKSWWSGEHEGYWKDGMLRSALLADQDSLKTVAKIWMENLKNKAIETGYLGIYSEGNDSISRFQHDGENGELWTQSRILVPMLAYFEWTQDSSYLAASELVVQKTIAAYKSRNPFQSKQVEGGVSHGVGFIEPLEWLYRITNKPIYKAFASKLYNDFSATEVRDDDLRPELLEVDSIPFNSHAPHISEGFLMPFFVSKIEKKPILAIRAFEKLKAHSTPSGALIGDEDVEGRLGSADLPYEYCCMAELINPLNSALALTGQLPLADHLERLVLNAAQGARMDTLTALSYLSTDNRMNIDHKAHLERFTFDVQHVAAACCALNGLRVMPYYVEGMWMKSAKGLALLYYGPSKLKTELNAIPVTIEQKTKYPFEDKVVLEMELAEPLYFELQLRKPLGCLGLEIELPNGIVKLSETKNEVTLGGEWAEKSKLMLRFHFKPNLKLDKGANTPVQYLQRGPLLYAMQIESKKIIGAKRGQSSFAQYYISPVNNLPIAWAWPLTPELNFQPNSVLQPTWGNTDQGIVTQLRDEKGDLQEVLFKPMGSTILRRMTFPLTTADTSGF